MTSGRSRIVLGTAAVLLLATHAVAQSSSTVRSSEPPRPGSAETRLLAPGGAWTFGIDLTGYGIGYQSSSAEVAIASLLAHDPDREMAVAVFVRKASGARSAEAARDTMWPRKRRIMTVQKKSVRQTTRPGMALVHSTATFGKDTAEVAKVIAYLAHEGAWIEVDISNDGPGRENAAEVERLLASVRIEPVAKP